MLDLLSNITPVYPLYLFYGASFLLLGVSILSKDMKGSDLKLANSLWLLGMFGLLHGGREWMELGPLIEGEHLLYRQLFAAKAAGVVLVVLSFLFLLQFGIALMGGLEQKRIRWVKAAPLPLACLWFLYFWHFGLHRDGFHLDMQALRQADIGARFTFGVAGGLLTAYGLIAYSRELIVLSRPVSKKLLYAGITFVFYALFAGILSSSSSLFVLPVPVELLRGLAAFLITVFIVKALNIFDIETRRKIELQARQLVQAEKLTSLGRLAAGIAHEINNPLTNASLGIQDLRRRFSMVGDVAAAEALASVERNIDRAAAIAQELLQFSHQRETSFAALDINAVIRSALTLMHFKMNGVAVVQNLAELPEVMGDFGKLEQVVINILSNSIESMASGGTVSITTAKDDDCVVVRIGDTGQGIPKKHLSQVFDPFFTTKEIGEGTGLGLSLSYGVIRQHGGTIGIASTLGRGTTVTLVLPTREKYEKDIDCG